MQHFRHSVKTIACVGLGLSCQSISSPPRPPLLQLPSSMGMGAKVAFFSSRFSSFDRYISGYGYLGGEAYWSACVEYILSRHLNITADFFWQRLPSPDETARYHRVILDGSPDEKLQELSETHPPGLLCRIRVMHFWGGWKAPAAFDARMVLTPWISKENAPVPIFPLSLQAGHHGLHTPHNVSAHAGLLLGKACEYFQGGGLQLISALLNRSFVLHATTKCAAFPAEIITHTGLTPMPFAKLLGKMAFLVGFADPRVSPTPLEALAQGAAYLHPSDTNQHPVLRSVGAPYVYNYRTDDPASLVRAALLAVRYPFDSFVPFSNRLETTIAAVATNLVAHDGVCVCLMKGPGHATACEGSLLQMRDGGFL